MMFTACGVDSMPDAQSLKIFNAVTDTGNYQAVAEYIQDGGDLNQMSGGLCAMTRFAFKDDNPTSIALDNSERSYDIAELMISNGADVNQVGGEGLTFLAFAALEGNKELCDILLAHGADINGAGGKNNPHTALEELFLAQEETFLGMFDYMLRQGAWISGALPKLAMEEGNGSVPYQSMRMVVEELQRRSIEPDIPQKLEHAILGKEQMLLDLVQAKEIKTPEDKLVLFFSAAYGTPKTLEVLQNAGFRLTEKDEAGHSLLHIAADCGNLETAEYLIGQGISVSSADKEGGTPIAAAFRSGQLEVADLLLRKGAKLKADRPGDEDVPANDPLTQALTYGRLDGLPFLLKQGIYSDEDLMNAVYDMWNNCANGYGLTRKERMEALLEAGMPPDLTALGESILDSACAMDEDSALLLINQGAAISDSCLVSACEQRFHSLIDVLIEKGTDVNHAGEPMEASIYAGDLVVLKKLVQHGADINYPYENGETPLTVACQQPSRDIIKFLLDKGARLDVQNADGETPYQLACDGYFGEEQEVLGWLR